MIRRVGLLLALLCLSPLAWGQVSWHTLTADPDLEARYNGDGNADDTGDAINAANPGTHDGTWTGTAAYGNPRYGLGKSFALDGSSYINAAVSLSDSDFTLLLGMKSDGEGISNNESIFASGGSVATGIMQLDYPTGGANLQVKHGGSALLTLDPAAPASTSWQRVCLIYQHSPRNLQVYVDGTLRYDDDPGDNLAMADPIGVGRNRASGAARWGGDIDDVRIYERAFSSAEAAEDAAGPEPHYTASASLGTDGSLDFGEWDAYSNGSVTYEWVAVLVDGTVVDSGTGPGTADLSGVDGETMVYLLVRASNDGGYDVGDFGERTSGYGSANDGYYEVASVETEASGPPASIARLIQYYNSMRRR